MARMIRPISGAPSPSIGSPPWVGVAAALRRERAATSPVGGLCTPRLLGGRRAFRLHGRGPLGGRLSLGEQRLDVALQAAQLTVEPPGDSEQAVAEDAEDQHG